MKLEELYTMISQDFELNDTEIIEETTKSSKLFIKYIQLWSDEKLRAESLDLKRKALVSEKRNWYGGLTTDKSGKKYPIVLKTDTAIQKQIDVDPDIQKLDESMIIQCQKVEILDACLKEIKNRGYQIKNIIEHRKFESGY